MELLNKLKNEYKNIGNTPLIKMVFEFEGQRKTVYAKQESLNPSGSIKVRPAYQILYDAIESGELKEGQRVVEVTSGNMGIGLTYLCVKIGNPITILMPKTMSQERIKILRDMGADVVLTNDFLEAFKMADDYIANGAYASKQFDNKSNPKAQENTAKEIAAKTTDFEAFISGVGTGGTLMGIGGYLKNNYGTKMLAIDPKESSLLLFGKAQGPHKIQGLSDQIIPGLYDSKMVDEIISISSDDAIVMARRICNEFNIKVGISSGANVLGALLSNYNSCATVFADDDKKYLSTDLYNEKITSELVDKVKLIEYSFVK